MEPPPAKSQHGYFNEGGVGQGIKDSGVPREEIWVTSKLWPSEYGEGTTMQAYEQGKVRALGISNFDNWPEAFNAIMENSSIKPQILQIECHPFAQRQETKALAQQNGLQIECWYPLGHADDRLLNNSAAYLRAPLGKICLTGIKRGRTAS